MRDEIAIVTGSSGRGTATEIARVFASEGAKVVVTGRSAERGAAVVDEIAAEGGEAAFVPCDVTDAADCERLVAETEERFGGLSVLVNSAITGIGRDGPVGTVDLDGWDETLRTNLTGAMLCTRFAVHAMERQGWGSIVNVGSRVAIRGASNLAAYTASKGALDALTRSIAVDYASKRIRCNLVAAGYIRGKDRDTPDTPERAQFFADLHLTDPPTTTEIAWACVYFASRESASVTGATLPVDGGGTAARGLTLG